MINVIFILIKIKNERIKYHLDRISLFPIGINPRR